MFRREKAVNFALARHLICPLNYFDLATSLIFSLFEGGGGVNVINKKPENSILAIAPSKNTKRDATDELHH